MRKDKKNEKNVITNLAVLSITSITILGICLFVTDSISTTAKIKHAESMTSEYHYLMEKVSEIDSQNIQLNAEIHTNLLEVYNRIKELSKSDPDEIRDKVIYSIDLNASQMIVQGSIIALLKNYEEFQEDSIIQLYLSKNADNVNRIKENNELKSSTIKFIQNKFDIVESDPLQTSEELFDDDTK